MRKTLEITPTGAAPALDLAVLLAGALATASAFPDAFEGMFTAVPMQNPVSAYGTLTWSSRKRYTLVSYIGTIFRKMKFFD